MDPRIRSLSPHWLAPAVGAAAVGIGALSVIVERGELDGVDSPEELSPLSLVLIGVVVVAWLIETIDPSLWLPVFIAIVVLPEAWFVYVGRNAAAPMFLILLVGWVAYIGTRREAGFALAAAILIVLLPLPWAAGTYLDWIGWLFGISFAWSSMLAIGTQQRLLSELRAAQADLARRAATEERQRIAREIHDVIAHTLAITMLHLTGARHILTRDPARASEALAQAEQFGRQSLADIRRTIGLLGGTSGDLAPAPMNEPLPDVGDLATLVAGFQRAGLNVHLTIEGDPGQLSAAAGLAVYRMAQEALANVVRHAPGAHASVALAIRGQEARLQVRDDGIRGQAPADVPRSGSTLGLLGMRERATLLGGTLVAGPAGSGWLVESVIPLDRQDTSAQDVSERAETGA